MLVCVCMLVHIHTCIYIYMYVFVYTYTHIYIRYNPKLETVHPSRFYFLYCTKEKKEAQSVRVTCLKPPHPRVH